jgi:hypothetical protein
LELYCKENLQKLKDKELEKNPIIKEKDVELGELKEWMNLFIEHVIKDNLFLTYLFKNDDFCSVLFQHEFFFDYVVHHLDENGWMGYLVNYWTTFRESDLEDGNENNDNKMSKYLNEEEKEDQQAIEEEELDGESKENDEDRKRKEEKILIEKRAEYRAFLINLNKKITRSDSLFGLLNGGEQGEQNGGGLCSNNMIEILKINTETLKVNISKAISETEIADKYGDLLCKQFEMITMVDVMNIYTETKGKMAKDVFQETENFKMNLIYEKYDSKSALSMANKEKEMELIHFILSIPDNKGYEILIDYILKNPKLKHNRFFLFRKLFEMMSEKDMIDFVNENTAVCGKVPEESLTSLGEKLGKVSSFVSNTLGYNKKEPDGVQPLENAVWKNINNAKIELKNQGGNGDGKVEVKAGTKTETEEGTKTETEEGKEEGTEEGTEEEVNDNDSNPAPLSPEKVVEKLKVIIRSGDLENIIDVELLSSILTVEAVDLLLEPQTIIDFLDILDEPLIEKMIAKIPKLREDIINKLKQMKINVDIVVNVENDTANTTITETKPETPPGKESANTFTITQAQFDRVMKAIPEIIDEKQKKLEKKIVSLGVSNIPLMMKLAFLSPSIVKLLKALIANVPMLEKCNKIIELLDMDKFSKILGIPDDKLKNLFKDSSEIFKSGNIDTLTSKLPGLFENMGLDKDKVGDLTNKIKNQDAAQEADAAAAASEENEPEAQCSEKLGELLTKVVRPNQGRPIDKDILEKMIKSSINKKNIEYLFEKEVIDKILFPKPEIKNTMKRFMAVIIGFEQDIPSPDARKNSEIRLKIELLDKVFAKLSNFNLRKVIVSVFENLSNSPISVSNAGSYYTNSSSTSLYLQRMQQFYTGYILKKDVMSDTERTSDEIKDKLEKLMNHMQKYSKKTGLGVLKDRSKPLDRLRYICQNKQNATRKISSNNSNRTSYKKLNLQGL